MSMENLQAGDMQKKIEKLENEIRNLNSRMLEQRELEQQLFHAQKMESLANLAAGIAHDLNNILQSILGYTQIALLEKSTTDPDYEVFDKIEKIVQKGRGLTRQFLTFGRRISSELKPFHLNPKIIEIKELLQRTIPRMIRIDLELADDLSRINADAGQIEQILMNLSLNAKDAMPEGGTLTFKTENVMISDHHPLVHLNARPGPYVLLTVSDTGIGISPEIKKFIFEPFFTTKEKEKGTGLGLAMVYAIVKNHDGFIDVVSQPHQGTLIRIHLPATENKPISLAEQIHPNHQPIQSFGHERILLVDDEQDIIKICREILNKNGYEVVIAFTGEEAIKKYTQSKIDLVILDVDMPGMGGIKCLQHILAINPQAKVLISSGYVLSDLVQKALSLGATDYLTKPFPLESLAHSARVVLDNSCLHAGS